MPRSRPHRRDDLAAASLNARQLVDLQAQQVSRVIGLVLDAEPGEPAHEAGWRVHGHAELCGRVPTAVPMHRSLSDLGGNAKNGMTLSHARRQEATAVGNLRASRLVRARRTVKSDASSFSG